MKKILLLILIFALSMGVFACTVAPADSSSINSSQESSISSNTSETPSSSSVESSSSSILPSSSSEISSSSSSSGPIVCVGLSITGQKVEFVNGEEFSYGGLLVTATMSDGSSSTLAVGEYVVDSSNYNKKVQGEYTIIVSALGKNVSYPVTVGAPYLVGISVSGQKTEFKNGESFSVGSLVVKTVMSDETSSTINASQYVVDSSNYNKNVQGTYTIVVTALEKTTSYSVTVGAPYVVSISVSGQKTEFKNGETFSKGSLVVTATKSDGSTLTLEPSQYTIDSKNYDKNVQGTYTIVVTALEKTTSYSVSVGAPYVVSISLSGQKTTFEFGESFSVGSLVVTATMSNGSTQTISNGYSVDSSSYKASTAGTYAIKVTYSGQEKSYNVTVKEEEADITGISLSGQKTTFAFAEDFSVGGLVVTASLSNGKTKTLTSSEYTVDYSAYNCMQAKSYTITVAAKGTSYKKTYTAKVNVADKLKVLMIGNSFADDTIAHSWEVATALGIDPANIVVADLYIGGCTLKTHWTNAQNNSPAYRFGLERQGWADGSTYTEKTIEWGIKYAKWDFITFQQGSGSSGHADTYVYLQNLMDYVRGIATDTVNNPNANPNVKFVWHQTWAYANDSTNTGFPSYGGPGSQLAMYNMINDCVKTQVLTKPEFVALIPNGTAVQNARTSLIGDNLTRDQYDHLTYDIGRYMTALNMVSILTGRDFSDITWVPEENYGGGVVGVYKDICLESVKNAQANPLQITNSQYKEPDVSSLYLFDWQPTANAYWYSTNDTYNALITTASNSVNFVSSSIRFTKSDIPVGSVIVIEEGYQFRPDAWITDEKQTSRPANYSTKYLEVTESFWEGYTYRAFNVSNLQGTSLKGKYEEAANALKIYVPYQTSTENTAYSTDKQLLVSIDNYERLQWMPTNGYYSATSLPVIVTDDATNCPNYVATQIFTRQTLPIGSIIVVDAGYRYRPEGWETLNAKYTERGTLTSCTETTLIFVTEDWWANFNYRAFNFGKTGEKANANPYAMAQHFRIYIPKHSFSKLDLQLKDYSFWNTDSTAYNNLQSGTYASSTASKFVGSQVLFTKAELPVGSIITIANGFGYRPDGLNANKDRNGASGTSGLTRPGNVSTTAILVTEEWWGDFVYRGFNVYKADGKKIEEAELQTVKQALKIYIPSTSLTQTVLFKGQGTKESPYLIETAEDMYQLSYESLGRNYGKGLYFKLVNDIDLSAKNWQPICFNDITQGWPTNWYYFEGNFDGNGKTITVKIEYATDCGVGLFAGISGTVSNLTINGSVVADSYSGALAGRVYNGAVIDGVTNNASVTGTSNQIGGLVGNAVNSATVVFKNCVNNGDVTGVNFVGGILGGAWADVSYQSCTNTGDITGTSNVAGITGETYTSKWTTSGLDANCTNTGTITGTSNYGELVGKAN